MLTNWWSRQNAAQLKLYTKVCGGGIFDRFANFDKCLSEVAGDVISGVTVD